MSNRGSDSNQTNTVGKSKLKQLKECQDHRAKAENDNVHLNEKLKKLQNQYDKCFKETGNFF